MSIRKKKFDFAAKTVPMAVMLIASIASITAVSTKSAAARDPRMGEVDLVSPFLGAGGQYSNIPAPTMGGKQFWSDLYYQSGWRVQKNTMTGHHRLLDPDNVRRAWGSYHQCVTAFEKMRPKEAGPLNETHLVILVHGILRSGGSFSKLQAALENEGYGVAAISYASTRYQLVSHAENLAHLIANLKDVRRVSIVTHSMGALVVRQMLGDPDVKLGTVAISRIVMVAPPNQGSKIAEALKDVPAYRWIYGRSGQELPGNMVAGVPGITAEFGVLAGGRGDGAGYNPFLPGDDDAVVSVAETRLTGMADFKIIRAAHSTILSHPETAGNVLSFLKTGHFRKSAMPSNREGKQQ